MRFAIALLAIASLTACSGKPSESVVADALEDAAKAGLVVNGFKVPAAAVKVEDIDVGAIQKQDPLNGMDRYYVEGKVSAVLMKNGDDIGAAMRNASREAASGADIRDLSAVVMGGAFGAAQARNALKNYPAGTRFQYPLQAVMVRVDGEWRVADFRAASANVYRSAEQAAAEEKAVQDAVANAEAAAKAAELEAQVEDAQSPEMGTAAIATDAAADAAANAASYEAPETAPPALLAGVKEEAQFGDEEAVDAAEMMAREAEAQQAEQNRLKQEEARRAEAAAERRQIEEARKQADALKRLQEEHAAKLDAEDPIRK